MEETAIPPLLGVIGHPIAGNPMQFAMERALIAAQLEWRFLSFDVSPDRLGDAVAGVDALGFRGLAVAPPHSVALLDLVPQHSRTAAISGWVDAIRRGSDGSLIAENLLGDSLIGLLGTASVAGSSVALLGSTPESLALFATLITLAPQTLLLRDVSPAELAPAVERYKNERNKNERNHSERKGERTEGERNEGRGECGQREPGRSSEADVARERSDSHEPLESRAHEGHGDPSASSWGPRVSQLDDRDEAELSQIQVLVRGGLSSSAAAEAKILEKQIGRLRDDCVVVDLAVSASTSPLLRTAADRGLPTISAIDLLVARAAMAFRLWTGRQADRTALQEAFEEYLEI